MKVVAIKMFATALILIVYLLFMVARPVKPWKWDSVFYWANTFVSLIAIIAVWGVWIL